MQTEAERLAASLSREEVLKQRLDSLQSLLRAARQQNNEQQPSNLSLPTSSRTSQNDDFATSTRTAAVAMAAAAAALYPSSQPGRATSNAPSTAAADPHPQHPTPPATCAASSQQVVPTHPTQVPSRPAPTSAEDNCQLPQPGGTQEVEALKERVVTLTEKLKASEAREAKLEQRLQGAIAKLEILRQQQASQAVPSGLKQLKTRKAVSDDGTSGVLAPVTPAYPTSHCDGSLQPMATSAQVEELKKLQQQQEDKKKLQELEHGDGGLGTSEQQLEELREQLRCSEARAIQAAGDFQVQQIKIEVLERDLQGAQQRVMQVENEKAWQFQGWKENEVALRQQVGDLMRQVEEQQTLRMRFGPGIAPDTMMQSREFQPQQQGLGFMGPQGFARGPPNSPSQLPTAQQPLPPSFPYPPGYGSNPGTPQRPQPSQNFPPPPANTPAAGGSGMGYNPMMAFVLGPMSPAFAANSMPPPPAGRPTYMDGAGYLPGSPQRGMLQQHGNGQQAAAGIRGPLFSTTGPVGSGVAIPPHQQQQQQQVQGGFNPGAQHTAAFGADPAASVNGLSAHDPAIMPMHSAGMYSRPLSPNPPTSDPPREPNAGALAAPAGIPGFNKLTSINTSSPLQSMSLPVHDQRPTNLSSFAFMGSADPGIVVPQQAHQGMPSPSSFTFNVSQVSPAAPCSPFSTGLGYHGDLLGSVVPSTEQQDAAAEQILSQGLLHSLAEDLSLANWQETGGPL